MRNKELELLIFDEKLPFLDRARQVWNYQTQVNELFRTFNAYLKKSGKELGSKEAFSLLPISAFKETEVISGSFNKSECLFFQSSGTSATTRSKHLVAVPEIYHQASQTYFFSRYPEYPIYAYVPSYADNPHSSLIYMIQELIQYRKQYLNDTESTILETHADAIFDVPSSHPIVLFGAAFGLLDATDNRTIQLHPNSILIETGGMKTFRKELSRKDLHRLLQERFGLNESNIHSEYGMAELLSQAYKSGYSSPFYPPHWMQISIRNPQNPLQEMPLGEEGQIGVIDLANLYSCSFILTEDRGFATEDGGFEVLGRLAEAELRGCNFLFERD
jgi:hypothetical protein